MNDSTQVWIVSRDSSEPRMVPLGSRSGHDFFATEAEAFDFIAEREMNECHLERRRADEAEARAHKAFARAKASRATEAARGTPGESAK